MCVWIFCAAFFNVFHIVVLMNNIYWYSRQTQIIMYWNLLTGCLTSSLGQHVSVFLWPSCFIHWKNMFGLSVTIMFHSLEQHVSVFLWPSCFIHWNNMFRSFCDHHISFIGTTCFGLSVTITFHSLEQHVSVFLWPSCFIHWNNMFRSFFDHHQVLKDGNMLVKERPKHVPINLWRHAVSKFQYKISCVWRL